MTLQLCSAAAAACAAVGTIGTIGTQVRARVATACAHATLQIP